MDRDKYKELEKNHDKAVYLVGLMLLCIVGFFLYKTSGTDFFDNPTNWGVFGDYVGGTLNPILGFFSFMLLLLNLYFQRKQIDKTEEQLDLSRAELKLTREELKKAADAQVDSAKVMNEQLKTQFLQQFDSLFFSLVNKLIERVDRLEDKESVDGGSIFFKKYKRILDSNSLNEMKNQTLNDQNLNKIFILFYQILRNIDEKIGNSNLFTKNQKWDLSKNYSNILMSLLPERLVHLLLIQFYDEKDNRFVGINRILEALEVFKYLNFNVSSKYFNKILICSTKYSPKVFGNSYTYQVCKNHLFYQLINLYKIDDIGEALLKLFEINSIKESINFEEKRIFTLNYNDEDFYFGLNDNNIWYGPTSAGVVTPILDVVLLENNKILLGLSKPNCGFEITLFEFPDQITISNIKFVKDVENQLEF